MKHPDLKIKSITIKETPAFKVRVESWESISPAGLMAVDIVQECLNDKGEISSSSTYNFHMSRDEIKRLCEGLLSV
jgi:hypothetical protein